MKKFLTAAAWLLLAGYISAQTTDFIPGANIIFEDRFDLDPVGDFPAKWSTSSEGQVVQLDGFPGKWLKINASTAVNPELKKKLPEDCTIEFDLVVKNESCPVLFGLTPLSDVSAGNVYYKKIFVTLQRMVGYPNVVFGKDVRDLGSKSNFDMNGYVDRVLHVSIAVNKTRFRVYLDETKVVDLPKLLVPEYRNNFFVAGGEVIPAPEEGIYISNIRIAAGEADARSLLIKQLMEQGSVVTSDIQFSSQTNTMTPESQPVADQLGQALQQNPDMNIQINTVQETPLVEGTSNAGTNTTATGGQVINKEALKLKADKIKEYIVNKFKVKADRIITDAKVKAVNAIEKNKTLNKMKTLLTEIIKL